MYLGTCALVNKQVFNFFSPKLNSPPPQRMHKAINAYLPEDIRILHVEQVPMDFHARFSAFSKLYSFQIQLGETADPIKLGLCQHVFQELDLNAMRCALDNSVSLPLVLGFVEAYLAIIENLARLLDSTDIGSKHYNSCSSKCKAIIQTYFCRMAALQLEGTHDFTQFSSMHDAPYRVSPVKTLSRVEVRSIPGGLEILFDGSGFLYNQCRHMAACLIRVGIGSYPVEGIGRLLELGEKGGKTPTVALEEGSSYTSLRICIFSLKYTSIRFCAA